MLLEVTEDMEGWCFPNHRPAGSLADGRRVSKLEVRSLAQKTKLQTKEKETPLHLPFFSLCYNLPCAEEEQEAMSCSLSPF